MQNPLIKVPVALPALLRANALRRRVQAAVGSFDVLSWPGVRYGEDPAQVMRIWELNDLGPRDGWPAVLLIHGGGWVEGDLSDFEALAPSFARRGIVAAAMNYRLGPQHRWPAALEDAHAALDRLLGAQVDPRRVAVWGHSAGGHLALMLALQRPQDLRGVVAMGAPTDLPLLGQHERPVGGGPGLQAVFDPDQLEAASPLSLRPEDPPPMLLVHGDADPVVPVGHARALHARWPDRASLIEIPDGDHGIRWPPLAAVRARRQALDWIQERLEPAGRGSKWKIRRKGRR